MANLDRNDTREGKIKFSWQRFREATYIFRYMYPYRWYFIVGMVLLFLSSLVFMVFPYLAGEMTDIATGNAKHDFNLNQIGLALIIILVLQAVFSYFRIWTFTVVSEKGMADVCRREPFADCIFDNAR
jgi:ABC-type multidrug transport system fused ATPase/permease subunit